MIKRLILLGLALTLALPSYSQYWKLIRTEAYIGAGPSNYFGDIGGTTQADNLFGLRDIQIFGTRPSFYAGIKYRIVEDLMLRANFNISFLGGSDVGSKNEERNFAFTSTLVGADFLVEYAFIKEDIISSKYSIMNLRRGYKKPIKLLEGYGFAGIGYNRVKVFPGKDLKEFSEKNLNMVESINHDYRMSSNLIAFPVGIGFKFVFNRKWSFGVEAGFKYTTSDFLDGFTTSVSKAPDFYYFSNLYFIHRIYRKPKF